MGQQIRAIRMKKGIGLNEYAVELGVSKGYLSNLETGKTETIQLSILERIISDLNLVPFNDSSEESILSLRLQKIHHLLRQLDKKSPETVDHLLSTLEKSTELFSKLTVHNYEQ
ncbi:helix-turn-helix transcriptional regulator [Paenibacillus frigoriresistens]|nr:helix-turn-helix transcriptional regulator [Paenibacillus frigoriresistens]